MQHFVQAIIKGHISFISCLKSWLESWVEWIVTSLLLRKHLSASWCNAHVISCPQHHCRKCGKAICGKCSSKLSTYPIMGFEFQVRMCDDCYDTIKEEEWVLLVGLLCVNTSDDFSYSCVFVCCSRTPLAAFHEGKHNIAHMDMDPSRGLMVTSGSDRVVKVLISFLRL